jgi:hypothetical protein
LDPDEALEIYLARTKIEPSFKDLKNLLRVDRVMSKRRENMGKIIALMLISYSMGLLIGEAIRDEMYTDRRGNSGGPPAPGLDATGRLATISYRPSRYHPCLPESITTTSGPLLPDWPENEGAAR